MYIQDTKEIKGRGEAVELQVRDLWLGLDDGLSVFVELDLAIAVVVGQVDRRGRGSNIVTIDIYGDLSLFQLEDVPGSLCRGGVACRHDAVSVVEKRQRGKV